MDADAKKGSGCSLKWEEEICLVGRSLGRLVNFGGEIEIELASVYGLSEDFRRDTEQVDECETRCSWCETGEAHTESRASGPHPEEDSG
jgi:hypothetical protein